MEEIHKLATALAIGRLDAPSAPSRSPIVGSLKALQSSLRHLTWQAQQIARGDFSQRVEFMGDFSRAFNHMVEQLARARADLVEASTHDALTGLYNRAFFDAEMDRLARGRSFPVAVIFVDIDGLKTVNDAQGHAAGDALIIGAAKLLTSAFRAEDVVARVGGDEFAVLLPGVDEVVARRILERLAAIVTHQPSDGPVVSMSVGMSVGVDGSGLLAALRVADERMYANKVARRASRD
jgi:diguanylate cyclase (GGDEF)-like protein